MNTYREFSLKQQFIFYAICTFLVGVCVYLDFATGNLPRHKFQHTSSITETVNKHVSSYEVAHSATDEFKVQLAQQNF